MNKTKKITITIFILLILIMPLVLSACVMDYRVSELQYDNLISQAKTVNASSGSAKNAIDKTVSSAWAPKSTGDSWLEITFKSALSFNAVALKEDGCNVKIFKLQVLDGDSWKTIYYSDGIGNYRLCSFNLVTSNKLRLYVNNAIDNFKIREVLVYNIDKPVSTNFEKTAFIKLSKYIEMYQTRFDDLQEYLSFYDNIVLTNTALSDANGVLSYSASIKAIQEVIADINKNGTKASINILNNSNDNPIKTASACETLALNIAELIKSTNANGISIQFMYLVGTESWRAYNYLIKKIDTALNMLDSRNPPSLSLILESAHIELEKKTCILIDKVYYYGEHAKQYCQVFNDFYNNCYYATNLLSKRGFTADKIILTLPLYASAISKDYKFIAYNQLVDIYGEINPWQNLYINVPFGDGFSDFCLQSPSMARDKAVYAKALGLGGFGVMGLSYDMPIDSQYSITKIIADALS